tara:strand:+ start:780 stop:1679 length:900 start_codon:yes stop_codon:yes gene_type:complete
MKSLLIPLIFLLTSPISANANFIKHTYETIIKSLSLESSIRREETDTFFNTSQPVQITQFFSGKSPKSFNDPSTRNFIQKIEKALNSKEKNRFNQLFLEKSSSKIKKNHNSFLKRFSNTSWSIISSKKIKDESIVIELLINGEKNINSTKYYLESKQIIEIKRLEEKILKYDVISEYSILKSADTPLRIKIDIPDSVLTGSRYDANIILKDPLGEAFISGGLISTEMNQNETRKNPFIDLQPIGAGGLFKSVQAPLIAGEQTLVGLITHPEGIISITKKINIVSKSEDLAVLKNKIISN